MPYFQSAEHLSFKAADFRGLHKLKRPQGVHVEVMCCFVEQQEIRSFLDHAREVDTALPIVNKPERGVSC